MKAVVWGSTIAIMTAYKREKCKLQLDLLSSIKTLEAQHKKTGCKKVYKHLLLERRKLDTLEISWVQQNILFLRQHYCLHCPKQMKLLDWKVQRTKTARQIHVLKDRSRKQITRMVEILAAFWDYYSSLYSSSGPHKRGIHAFLQKHFKDKCFLEEHVRLLDAPISPEEVLGAIKLLKNGKSPGNNGFPVEFYKRYSQHLVPPLT